MNTNVSAILADYSRPYQIRGRGNNSFSAQVYHIGIGKEKYVLKISYDKNSFLNEIKALSWLNHHEFPCPALIEASEKSDGGSFVMSYLEGRNGDDTQLTKAHIREIAERMTELHQMPLPDGLLEYNFCYIDQIFWQNIKKIVPYCGKEVCENLEEYYRNHSSLLKNRTFDSLIHRDYRLGNMIFSGSSGYLIDFESCAAGDPVMDLMKIYPEISRKDQKLSDYFLSLFAPLFHMDQAELIEVIAFYTFLDKINAIVWCAERNRIQDPFFEENRKYLLELGHINVCAWR